MTSLLLAEDDARARAEDRDRRRHVDNIVTFVTVLLIGFLAAWTYHYVLGVYQGRGFPDNSFLMHPDGGSDFRRSMDAVRSDAVYDVPETFYFPFTYVLLRPFRLITDQSAQFIFLLGFATVTAIYLWRQLEGLRRLPRFLITFVTMGFNYAFLFELDRSNLEALVFVFLALHLLALRSDHRIASAVLLAAATAMKLYPGVFVVLFLARRWYREAALTVVLSLVFVLGSAALIEGGVTGSLGGLREQLSTTLPDMYVLGDWGIKFNSTLYALLRLSLIHLNMDTPQLVTALQLPYTVFGFVVSAAVAWYILRVERVLWKQVTLLTLVFILLPQVSFDYRLMHLLLPLGLFFASGFDGSSVPRWGRAYAVLFALVMMPKAYYQLPVPEGRDFALFYDVNIGVVLNPLLMLALAGTLVVERIRPGGSHTAAAEESAPEPVPAVLSAPGVGRGEGRS